MTLNPLIENHQIISALWDAVNTSSGSLENVGPLIIRVIDTGAWRSRIVPQLGKEPVQFDDFLEFIESKPLRGCGWPRNKITPLLKDDPIALEKWRQATTAPKGTNQHSDNITTLNDGRGTSRAYTLARLKRERQDLFERVIAKELSANAAAIEAGWRKKPKLVCPQCGHEFTK